MGVGVGGGGVCAHRPRICGVADGHRAAGRGVAHETTGVGVGVGVGVGGGVCAHRPRVRGVADGQRIRCISHNSPGITLRLNRIAHKGNGVHYARSPPGYSPCASSVIISLCRSYRTRRRNVSQVSPAIACNQSHIAHRIIGVNGSPLQGQVLHPAVAGNHAKKPQVQRVRRFRTGIPDFHPINRKSPPI